MASAGGRVDVLSPLTPTHHFALAIPARPCLSSCCLVVVNKQKKIKSITITGHSLGGALASMCGFDLSTTITEACGNLSVATAGARYPSPFVDYKPSLLHRFFNFTSKIMDKLHTKGMTKLVSWTPGFKLNEVHSVHSLRGWFAQSSLQYFIFIPPQPSPW